MVDGTTYELDPALKRHEMLPGLDLQAASGYNRTALRQAVGGTTTSHSVRGLNEAALDTTLTAYTTQLQATLRQTMPRATSVEVVGGLRALPETITSLPLTLALPTVEPVATWACLSEEYNTQLSLTLGTASAALLAATVSGPTVEVTMAVDHPHGLIEPGGTVNETVNDQTETTAYRKGDAYTYALIYGFTPSGQLLQQRQWRLDQAIREAKAAYPGAVDAQGQLDVQQLSDPVVKRRIVTELLNILGLQWLYQTALSERLIAAQQDILPLAHHRFGRVAQEEGSYIDVRLQLSGGWSRYGKDTDEETALNITAYFWSAMEHGVLEQMPGTGNTALSTIKLLQLANRSTETTRDEILLATASTFGTVRSRLQGYAPEALALLEAQANGGATLLLTEHATYTLNAWTGTGSITVTDTPDGLGITMSIDGGFPRSRAVTIATRVRWKRPRSSPPRTPSRILTSKAGAPQRSSRTPRTRAPLQRWCGIR